MGQPTGSPDPGLRLSRTLLRTDRPGSRVTARVSVTEPSRVRLRVTDFDGRTMRVLFEGERDTGTLMRRWDGRDADGRMVVPGPYRVEVTVTPPGAAPGLGSARVEAWLTVAHGAIRPSDPGSITVVVDPGHGGSFTGAVAPDGTREADLNLDIGLRLARMLEGAGVDVVLTRAADREVNAPPGDRIPDGVIDVTDDLAARVDLANAARADLFIAIHNNFAVDTATGGPSTYYVERRAFGDRSARLASIIQARMVRALGSAVGGDWRPYDHGSLVYPYYVLRDYDPPRLLRPTRMPGVLSEGLFLSNPGELRSLKRPSVRQAMANAYYEAIELYLAERGSHVGYALVGAPTAVRAGATLGLEVEVRDQGTTTLRGWRLVVGAQPVGSTPLGRARPGSRLAERRMPVISPGQRRTVRIVLAAPPAPGAWVLLVDAIDDAGVRVSRSGSPMLEVPISVLAEPPASVSLTLSTPTPTAHPPAG